MKTHFIQNTHNTGKSWAISFVQRWPDVLKGEWGRGWGRLRSDQEANSYECCQCEGGARPICFSGAWRWGSCFLMITFQSSLAEVLGEALQSCETYIITILSSFCKCSKKERSGADLPSSVGWNSQFSWWPWVFSGRHGWHSSMLLGTESSTVLKNNPINLNRILAHIIHIKRIIQSSEYIQLMCKLILMFLKAIQFSHAYWPLTSAKGCG
jgi:hypothetical protein